MTTTSENNRIRENSVMELVLEQGNPFSENSMCFVKQQYFDRQYRSW